MDACEAFQALGDPTRLRIVALLRAMELSVGELAQVLGQSQPRVSRHVKILIDAGLVERRKEGSWVFLSLGAADRVEPLFALLDAWGQDASADIARLAAVQADRAAGSARRAMGVDRSPEMLRLARVKLAQAGVQSELRQGDMYALPVASGSADTVILHQVLHYAQQPAAAVAEAARLLAPGGRLLIVDFAPHEHEELRSRDQHVRLGFADESVARWMEEAGLDARVVDHLEGGELTVTIWLGARPEARLELVA
jgi:ArsR family transcriptional regulator